MSVYDEISNRIGWFGAVDIPSAEFAKNLLQKVLDEECQSSFETVLKIHRFAPAPVTEEEIIALDFICEAYRIGKLIFMNK